MHQRDVKIMKNVIYTITQSCLVDVSDQIGDADKWYDVEVNLPDQSLLSMWVYVVRKSMHIGENSERDIIIGRICSKGFFELRRCISRLMKIALSVVCLDSLSIKKGATVHGGMWHDEVNGSDNT
jgi:hypothetical protein